MRQVPALRCLRQAGQGAISEIFLRGAESNFTVVLIDGVRVNDTSNARGGGFDFSTLNPDEIERVEIVRGPLSAVHGSDAMAGLISIETRLPGEEPVTRFRGEIGAEGYSRALRFNLWRADKHDQCRA
ncbi:MAG: TonB-dependent receptor plug domain-containing protein [Terricaulis sp.]